MQRAFFRFFILSHFSLSLSLLSSVTVLLHFSPLSFYLFVRFFQEVFVSTVKDGNTENAHDEAEEEEGKVLPLFYSVRSAALSRHEQMMDCL